LTGIPIQADFNLAKQSGFVFKCPDIPNYYFKYLLFFILTVFIVYVFMSDSLCDYFINCLLINLR